MSDAAGVTDLISGHSGIGSDVVLVSGSDPDRLALHHRVITAAKDAGARHVHHTSAVRDDDERIETNADHRATGPPRKSSSPPGSRPRSCATPGTSRTTCSPWPGPATPACSPPPSGTPSWRLPAARTSPEASAVVLGHDVTYVPVSPGDLRAQLVRAGMDEGLTAFLVSLDEDIATGTFSRVGDDLTRLIGRPTTGLVEALTNGARP